MPQTVPGQAGVVAAAWVGVLDGRLGVCLPTVLVPAVLQPASTIMSAAVAK
jgi:hypothetical protein